MVNNDELNFELECDNLDGNKSFKKKNFNPNSSLSLK